MLTNSQGSWYAPRLSAVQDCLQNRNPTKPSLVGFLFCRRHQQTRQIPQQMQISQLLQPDDFTHCWTIWCGRSSLFKTVLSNSHHVLHRILPNNKILTYYIGLALIILHLIANHVFMIIVILLPGCFLKGPIDQLLLSIHCFTCCQCGLSLFLINEHDDDDDDDQWRI